VKTFGVGSVFFDLKAYLGAHTINLHYKENRRLRKVSVVAHRGASAYEPENTLRSVKRALEMGADMVEVDVHTSRDGHIVVIHDAKVERTTNGKGYVKDLTLKELRNLDAGLGEKIPTLEEIVELMRGKAQLVIEIKVPRTEEKVLGIIKEGGLRNNVLIASFYHPTVKHVKELDSNIKTGIIISSRPVKPAQLVLNANSDVLFPRYVYVDKEMVREVHKNDLAVYPWTIDDPDEMRSLIEMDVDGIVTNRPDVLKSL